MDLDELQQPCRAEGLAFSNDGALLLVIERREHFCKDFSESQIVAFSTNGWKPLWDICVGIGFISALASSPDGNLLAVGGFSSAQVDQSHPLVVSRPVVTIVDIPARRVVRTISGAFPDHFYLGALAWSPDGKRLAVGLQNRSGDSRTDAVKTLDSSSGDLISSENAEFSDVSGLAFTSDGRYFMEGAVNKEVRIWDGSREHLLQGFRVAWGSTFGNAFETLAVSPDNRYLVLSRWRSITVYELK